MKIAYFDCFSGISGDMFLGSLIHAGLDPNALEAELRKLPLDGWHLHIDTTHRHAIAATRFEVHTDESDHAHDAHGHSHSHEHSHDGHHHHGDHKHGHDHAHGDHAHAHGDHTHKHDHDHHHAPDGHTHEHPHRGLDAITKIIQASALSDGVKETALRIFDRLADAESAAHQVPKDEIHFHEVGAVDAIIDIVGASVAVHLLGIEEIVASPLPIGRGFVKCAHGLMPIPVPGTLELLKNVPVYPTEINRELITPTGAAIITTLASGFGAHPEMTIEAVGYGAGKRDLKEQPNMLRVTIGKKKPLTRDF